MFSSPPRLNVEASPEMASAFYAILFSEVGIETFITTLRRFSAGLINRVKAVYDRLIKEKFFEQILGEEKAGQARKELGEESTKFSTRISELSKADVLEIKKYLIPDVNGNLTMEGFMMGIFDWLNVSFQKYNEFIVTQYNYEYLGRILDEILKKIPDDTFATREKLKNLGISVKSTAFRDVKQADSNYYDQLGKNIKLARVEIDYKDWNILKKITGNNPKKLDRLLAEITRLENARDMYARDRLKEFREELYSIVTSIAYDLSGLRDDILPKDLLKELAKG
jgi:hypothetical protein